MRKQLQAQHGRVEREKKIEELEKRQKKQKKKIAEQKEKIEAIQAIIEKKSEDDSKRRQEEVKFLQQQSEHLKRFLKQIELANRQQWARWRVTFLRRSRQKVSHYTFLILRYLDTNATITVLIDVLLREVWESCHRMWGKSAQQF